MADVTWTETALQELNEIAEYIALDKPLAARRLVAEVFGRADSLKDFPIPGRIPPELPDTVYREVVVAPCRIFYREGGDRVLVLHVMRQERELRQYMLEND